jgi:hypothetical protein
LLLGSIAKDTVSSKTGALVVDARLARPRLRVPRSSYDHTAKPITMSRRRAVDDEWDIHKDDILKLYVEEDKPLSEVKTTMDSQGFKRT